MRVVMLSGFLAACGFAPNAGTPPDGPGGDPGADASLAARSCHTTIADVRLCLDFEDPTLAPVIADNSVGRHDASAAAVTTMPRSGQQAALVTTGSSITVPETPDLDIAQNLTIEMWLEPTALGTTRAPLTNAGQYALGLNNDKITCTFGSHTLTSDAQLNVNTWAHVACSYDGTTIRVYLDGALDACKSAAGTIANTNTAGTVIASGFAGGIDDVHVYATTLTATQIQALAGVTSGNTSCP